MFKQIATLMVLVGATGGAFAGTPIVLHGTAPVSVTADTAALAKTRAIDSARRQILRQVLAPYTDAAQLSAAIKDTSSDKLANLIASSQIDREQQSATTYSANITMTADVGAVRKWLDEKNVQNRLPTVVPSAQELVIVTLRNRAGDWIELNRIARGENVELDTRNIVGNQITFAMPSSSVRGFVNAARAAGWQSSDDAGVMRMWK